MAECGSGLEIYSGWREALGRLDMAEASGWTLSAVYISGESFDSFNTCRHPSVGQILTTTYVPSLSHLSEPAKGKSGEQSGSEEFSIP